MERSLRFSPWAVCCHCGRGGRHPVRLGRASQPSHTRVSAPSRRQAVLHVLIDRLPPRPNTRLHGGLLRVCAAAAAVLLLQPTYRAAHSHERHHRLPLVHPPCQRRCDGLRRHSAGHPGPPSLAHGFRRWRPGGRTEEWRQWGLGHRTAEATSEDDRAVEFHPGTGQLRCLSGEVARRHLWGSGEARRPAAGGLGALPRGGRGDFAAVGRPFAAQRRLERHQVSGCGCVCVA
mmetsp:Transcript_14209/g.33828  ORF Transcript_14209/g.33828 Transcript_14209/m.33828 type:complete len:232 (-) Transcript_14209:1572-2267(-)